MFDIVTSLERILFQLFSHTYLKQIRKGIVYNLVDIDRQVMVIEK